MEVIINENNIIVNYDVEDFGKIYVNNLITINMLIGGLLTGSGISLLVLFKVNKNKKENIFILVSIYLIGSIVGLILELLNFNL